MPDAAHAVVAHGRSRRDLRREPSIFAWHRRSRSHGESDGRNSRTSASAGAAPARRRRLLQDGRGRHIDRTPSRRADRRGDHRHARDRQCARRSHEQARASVSRALRDEVALVSVQSPLRLDAYDEPEPDLMLLRPPTAIARAIQARPTSSSWSECRKHRWPTIGPRNSRSTPSSTSRRSGSSILPGPQSRFIAGPERAPMRRASG